MSTFTTSTRVDLDPQWVEDLLVTAFDGQYGGCWYWIREEEDLVTTEVLTDADGHWLAFVMHYARIDDKPLTKFNGAGPMVHLGDPGDGSITRTVTIEGHHLEKAWSRIVDESLIRDDLTGQFIQSMRSGDLDVDADAADCLVQIALFGEVVFS